MRRDSIWYKLFKQLPGLLFELTGEAPPNADRYRFDSVEVKESSFRIDGVFLPPEDALSQTIFFAEIQLQKDEALYRRFFSELFLFLRRSEVEYGDWAGVLIYGSRSMEPSKPIWYRSMLESPQVSRIYLDELGDWRELPLALGLVVLTNASEAEAPEQARFLLSQDIQPERRGNLLELISTIMFYKFSSLPREAIAAMLNIQDVRLEDTRVYQDIQEEVRLKDRQGLVLRLLTKQFGALSEPIQARIATMSLDQLEALIEVYHRLQGIAELDGWLTQNL
jgi:predicted transposase/invertase (TIGR01784 family)